jgi:hypothetical protein
VVRKCRGFIGWQKKEGQHEIPRLWCEIYSTDNWYEITEAEYEEIQKAEIEKIEMI